MRNLVLLLTSGHTVRIALRDDDRPTATQIGVLDFLERMSAVHLFVSTEIVFAYIEDPAPPMFDMNSTTFEPPNDLQRITVEGPGTVVQYG